MRTPGWYRRRLLCACGHRCSPWRMDYTSPFLATWRANCRACGRAYEKTPGTDDINQKKPEAT